MDLDGPRSQPPWVISHNTCTSQNRSETFTVKGTIYAGQIHAKFPGGDPIRKVLSRIHSKPPWHSQNVTFTVHVQHWITELSPRIGWQIWPEIANICPVKFVPFTVKYHIQYSPKLQHDGGGGCLFQKWHRIEYRVWWWPISFSFSASKLHWEGVCWLVEKSTYDNTKTAKQVALAWLEKESKHIRGGNNVEQNRK